MFSLVDKGRPLRSTNIIAAWKSQFSKGELCKIKHLETMDAQMLDHKRNGNLVGFLMWGYTAQKIVNNDLSGQIINISPT